MNKTVHRRLFSAILALIMALTILPMSTVFAGFIETDFNGYNAFEVRMPSGLLGTGSSFGGSLLAVRKVGAGLREWQVFESYNSGETHTISGLQDDVLYEYVFKYCLSGYEHSTKGTLQYNSSTADWTYTCPLDSRYFQFTQEQHPIQGSTLVLTATNSSMAPNNTYGATRQSVGSSMGTQFRTNAGAAALRYLEMYDADQTPLVHSSVYSGGWIYYFVPISATVTCNYVLEAPGYQTAAGTYNRASNSVIGVMTPSDPATHDITYDGTSYVQINLKADEISVSLTGLYQGTTLVPAGANSGMCTINSDNDKITFDLGGAASADVQVNVVHPGFVTVPLMFHIEGTVVTLLNEADISSTYTAKTITTANQFSFTSASGRMVLPQLPLYTLTFVPELGLYRATTTNLGAYVAHNMTYDPGRLAWLDFEIGNDTGKRLQLVDYSFSATNERIFNDLLRLDSPALQGYCTAKGIEMPASGNKSYIFNFEAIAGESFYDAMLWYFREVRGYSGITDLKQVPAEVIASELFSNLGTGSDYRFSSTTWGGDPSASYAVFVDTNFYAIRESDPDIWELAEWLLYNYALSITFNNTDQPVVTAGELSTLTAAQRATLYPAYRDKTSDNIAMMNRMLSRMQVIENGDYLRFDSVAFALNGSYIHNAYRGTDYEFDFTFDLFFAEVGVSGIAFLDKNANGVLDHPDEDDTASRFSGLTVELYLNGVSTGRTTTTNAYGYYHFDDVAEASGYEVRIQIPTGYAVTSTIVDSFDGNRFGSGGITDAFTVTLDRETYWFNAGFVAGGEPIPSPSPSPSSPIPTYSSVPIITIVPPAALPQTGEQGAGTYVFITCLAALCLILCVGFFQRQKKAKHE